ncbi:NUDIX hydrolase [Vibrio vulnificus]|nr:NUDIX hydrolase [Vibrio vulnificus]
MIKRLNENLVFKNQFAAVFNDDVEFKNGIKGTHLRVIPNPSNAIIVIPIMADGTVSMIENYRYSLGAPVIEFPQGGVMNSEPLSCAARRELLEEAGLECQKLTFAGRLCVSPSVMVSSICVFIAWGCVESNKEHQNDPIESIVGVKKLSLSEATDMFYDDEVFVDSTSISAFGYLSHYIEEGCFESVMARGYSYAMGYYCAKRGINIHGNPFRSEPLLSEEYVLWLKGWRAANGNNNYDD